MSLKIVVNTRALAHPVTGVERYLIELLARMGPKQDVFPCAPRVPTGGMKGHAWEQFVLPAKLRGRLLFSPCNTGPLAVARQVVTIHDVAALDHPEWLNAKFALWYRWLTPRLARRCQHIITVSEFTRSRIVAHTGVSAGKITVIPNGVDARFAPMARDVIDVALAPLALPSRKYILAVGSIEPRKNLPRLLEAWGKVLPTLPEDVWLVVAGGGNRSIFGAMTTDHGAMINDHGLRSDGQYAGVRSWELEDGALPQALPAEQNSSAALPQHSNSYLLASNSSSSGATEGTENTECDGGTIGLRPDGAGDRRALKVGRIGCHGGFTTEVGEVMEGDGEEIPGLAGQPAGRDPAGDRHSGVRSEKLEDGATPQASPAEPTESAALPKHSNSYLLTSNSSSAAGLRTYFAGRVAEELLPALYAGAMAFAYVSVYEGFGLPPLEAMAAGVAVLTGNLTSLPEVVGDAGIMVNPLDTDAIAAGLRQLVENAELRAKLGHAGVERAKRFTWEKAAAATAAALNGPGLVTGYR